MILKYLKQSRKSRLLIEVYKDHIIGKIWESISDSAKDLINQMIKFPPEDRLNAQDAFNHPWIQGKNFNEFKPEVAQLILNNLKSFQVSIVII